MYCVLKGAFAQLINISPDSHGVLPTRRCLAIARRLASVGEDKPHPASGLADCHWQSSR